MKAATSTTATDPQFHFIGGKGGVGKTTCAAAVAVADASAGARVLVVSTDPAPSLGDAFDVRLSRSPKLVAAGFGRPARPGTLHAVEIDASAVLRSWIGERRAALERIALEGTWLDREDVDRLLNLSLPGIDEVAGLLEIARLAETGRYERIIVDTAPTGHTLRMLEMPETLIAIARVFDRMRDKHRTMVEALRGGWTPEDEDRMIDDLARQARELRGLLKDPKRTRLSWVTLPEPMAVAETSDALAHLARRGIPVHNLIVNQVTPPPGRTRRTTCGHCDARRAFESKAIDALPPLARTIVFARDIEPRGITVLAAIGRELRHAREGRLHVRQTGRGARRRAWAAALQGCRMPEDALVRPSTRLVMFGGKGGVGKTTCAAAAAIACARRWPARQVALVSTDPAHSLGDVFRAAIGNRPSQIPGAPANLVVREMDAAHVLHRVRTKYAAAIDRLFDRIVRGSSFDIGHDRSVMHALIDLAPPGLDELAAIVEITESVSDGDDSLMVIDTAPTGHALRLLEMPALIHDWTKALMAIMLRYQSVTGLGELGEVLLNLSKGLGRLRSLLTDPQRTGFIVVTRAAALPRAETERLLRTLRRLQIDVPLVVVNAVGRGECRRCRKSAAAERREIAALATAFLVQARASGTSSRPDGVVVTATRIPPPGSPSGLWRWQRSGWRYHQDA